MGENSVRTGGIGTRKEMGHTVVIVLRLVAVRFGVLVGDHSTFARGYAPMSQRCSILASISSEGVS